MTEDIDTYTLMMQAYAEIKPEIEAAKIIQPILTQPPLNNVLDQFGPMPLEALFLGVAFDELPVLLNLHDPIPGPLLIISDPGMGKTSLLNTIARATEKMHQPSDVLFGTLTNHPDEWNGMNESPNNIGTFSIQDSSACDFITSLAAWAHEHHSSNQSILLLIDDLEALLGMDTNSVQDLRWLLLRGPSKRVWPIITLSTQYLEAMGDWLELFRTRILGKIQNPYQIQMLGAGQTKLNSYMNKGEFVLREGNHWLKFWTPS